MVEQKCIYVCIRSDPLIQRCLKYLRTVAPKQTYTVGLQTMAFCLAGQKEDRQLVQKNLISQATYDKISAQIIARQDTAAAAKKAGSADKGTAKKAPAKK